MPATLEYLHVCLIKLKSPVPIELRLSHDVQTVALQIMFLSILRISFDAWSSTYVVENLVLLIERG